MPRPPRERSLHGGAGRVVALAARSMGYRDGLACVLVGEEMLPISRGGELQPELIEAAGSVRDGADVVRRDLLAVPLLDDSGALAGALCVGGPPADRATDDDVETLRAFAAVLQDQMDLMRVLVPPPQSAAVSSLLDAIDQGHIQAWFQPLVHLDDGSLVGFEALARWRVGEEEVARPGDFVPLAEQSGLVDRLDMAVIRDAVEHLARWQQTRPELRISVNLSGRHLDEPDWVETILDVVQSAGVPPEQVDLELTESARPADVVRSVDQLMAAREHGFKVWFDDFGTGWSELRQLVEMPVDGIKVDRFFTEALGGRGESVVRAVLRIAEELGLDTVIEGVSTPEHATRARALGCDVAQGFLWSPAVPPEEIDAVLASGSAGFSAAAR